MDLRAQAKDRAEPEWRGLNDKQRRERIKVIRDKWREDNIGRVPASEDYDTWLRRQPAPFQDDVLSKKRGKLFRKGGLHQDQFVDFNEVEA